ncbi:TIGR01458 family HAD-type hydrolase [Methylocella sp.]|uniref:TIGR01458 family HAD-type hydrolase n=1 Tax=Methylocella sp. TaxID=1978226 RepID=UPI0037844783
MAQKPSADVPVRGALLDIDGVIATRGIALPGSVDAVRGLAARGVPVRFVTNTTRRPRRRILEDLRRLGVDAGDGDVFTPAAVAAALIAGRGLKPLLVIHPDLEEDFRDLACGDAPAVVIGDAGAHFTYERLNRAYRALVHGAEFYALAKNRNFQDADGELSLDAGPFVVALEHAARREAIPLGKPSPAIFHAAARSMGLEPGDVVMIGDDAESDVAGAMAAGLRGVLVRTGKYRPGEETRLSAAPDAVEDDLPAALRRFFP